LVCVAETARVVRGLKFKIGGNKVNAFINGRYQSHIEVKVSKRYRTLVGMMALVTSRFLGMQPPTIRFFYKGPGDCLLGYAGRRDNEICVAAGLRDTELLETIVHECRHLWQFQDPEWRGRAAWLKERDAILFELSWPR
jgi:hypothetical protein